MAEAHVEHDIRVGNEAFTIHSEVRADMDFTDVRDAKIAIDQNLKTVRPDLKLERAANLDDVGNDEFAMEQNLHARPVFERDRGYPQRTIGIPFEQPGGCIDGEGLNLLLRCEGVDFN